jgi:hypothetical protein
MDLTLLATLKEKLVTAENFSEVWTYFFDHFAEDPAFIALGDRTTSDFLNAVLAQVGGQLFKTPAVLAGTLLTRLPEHQFLHGACTLNGRLANIIYFEDIHTGLLAVVVSESPARTQMVRFTGRPLPVSRDPSPN